MSLPRPRPLPAAVLILAVLSGLAAVAAARWMAPFTEAERALADGRRADALAAYGAAEQRIGRFGLTRFLLGQQYAGAVYNQLALLYRGGDHDGVIAKAASAPAGAQPHLWSGLALMQLGMAEGKAETQVVWFTRAEEELRRALAASPDDWNTKYNYEIAARIVNELRRSPKKRVENPMQLLRPQPAQAPPIRKVG